MNPVRVQELLDLIEKASVPPPNIYQDQTRYDAVVARNEAIVTKAEADITAELAL